MKLAFKNTFLGYFQYYYNIIGNKLLVNFALSIVISFLDGVGLALFIPLLQSVGNEGSAKAPPTGKSAGFLSSFIQSIGFELNITTVLFFLVLLFAVKGLIKFIQLTYQVNLRYIFIKKIRFSLVDSLMNLSYRGFLKLDAGKIQNTLTSEVQRLFQSMNFYFLAAQSLVMLLTYVALAFFANYQFAFLVSIGAVMSNFIYRKIYIATKKASLEISKKGNTFNGFLIQSIHYFKYLKSTNSFSTFSKMLKDVIVKTEKINSKLGYYGAITSSVREPIIIIIVALVILVQVRFMGSSISSIVLSLLLFYRSLSFLMVVQNNWQAFIQNVGSMSAVASITVQMDEEQEVSSPKQFEGFENSIELKDVDFYYGENKILEKVNLPIPKNKTIALIGESGSGKTTLANLVAGLIAPGEGQLLVDGINLYDYNLDSYRSRIGYISQEPVIFTDNIFNNITFWAERSEKNLAKFAEVIKLSSLEEFIESQPEKDQTVLGDNGILISGGQKQRISIARELYKNAEILILDEATSALDSETEKIIQTNINKLHGTYTIILIAHRLSTIKEADAIYLLDKGKVVASGKFDEMLKKSEKFKRMVTLQEF